MAVYDGVVDLVGGEGDGYKTRSKKSCEVVVLQPCSSSAGNHRDRRWSFSQLRLTYVGRMALLMWLSIITRPTSHPVGSCWNFICDYESLHRVRDQLIGDSGLKHHVLMKQRPGKLGN